MSKRVSGVGANPFGTRSLVPSAMPSTVTVVPRLQTGSKMVFGQPYQWGVINTVAFPVVLHKSTVVSAVTLLVRDDILNYLLTDGSGLNTLYRALVCFRDSDTVSPLTFIPYIWTNDNVIQAPDVELAGGNYLFTVGFFNDAASLYGSTLSTYLGVDVSGSAAPFDDAWAASPGCMYCSLF